ncbi:MAG: hypothetical protein GC154_09695 [bacterium]|nr:hypothetical protein [bacterium]
MPSIILLLFLLLSPLALFADDARMEPWALDRVEAALQRDSAFQPAPRYQDRAWWEKQRESDALNDDYQRVVADAEELSKQPINALPATLYLDFQRTGRRTAYEAELGKRSRYLNTMALAECFEGEGRFIDPLIDILWAYCEESDWAMPAHTDGLIDMEHPYIDLRAAMTSADLAAMDDLFGDALPERVRKRIRYEIERRVFTPYLSRDFSWERTTNNWNAVCNGDIMRAALYQIKDASRLARIVTKGQNAMINYLDGFGVDGGTAEGLGYWSYGFGRYAEAARLLAAYTDGRLDLFAPPFVKKVALLPMRVELSPHRYPSFSDGGESYRFSPAFLMFLANRFDDKSYRRFAARDLEDNPSASSVEDLFEQTVWVDLSNPPREPFAYPDSTWLSGVQWLIARNDPGDPMGLTLAAKGGRNDESHNHNDVGNFIVHYRGESILTDLGAAVYDRGFFSSKRYDYWAARSMGHSVPLVNGYEQRAGGEAAAKCEPSLTDGQDVLTSDITSAYPPEAGLKSLIRTVRLVREKEGFVEITDKVEFNETPRSFESALMTYGKAESAGDDTLIVRGDAGALRVTVSGDAVAVTVDTYDTKEAKLRTYREHPQFQRIAFKVEEPHKTMTVRFRIEPM